MKKSNFLKKEDCGVTGILVTIKEVAEENVAKEGAPEELKWCCYFRECDKPLVLNSTNIQLTAAITGKQHTEDWPGYKVVLYNDPTVTYAGKIMGGIRVRAPRGQAAKANATQAAPSPAPAPAPATQPAPAAPAAEPESDDVPF
jgi:hypothetical protein